MDEAARDNVQLYELMDGVGARLAVLTGRIGHRVLLRSPYTQRGVRLNVTVTGVVRGDSMERRVSMGEYGMAGWTATRRAYRSAPSVPRPRGA